MKRSKETQDLINKLEGDYTQIHKFTYEGDEFVSNTKLRKFLNGVFSANLKAVYTIKSSQDANTQNGLDWSGETIIMINAKGEVVHMGNSEWAYIDFM